MTNQFQRRGKRKQGPTAQQPRINDTAVDREMPKAHRDSAKRARREAVNEREEELTAALFGGGGSSSLSTKAQSSFGKQQPSTKNKPNLQQSSHHDDNVPEDEFAFQIDRVGDHATTSTTNIAGNNKNNNEVTEQSDDSAESLSADADDGNDGGDDGKKKKKNSKDDQEGAAAAWVDEDDIDVDLAGPNASKRLRKLRNHRREKQVSSTTYENRLRERFVSTTQITAHTEWAAVKDDDDGDHYDSAARNDHDGILTSADALLATRGALPANILNLERCPDLNMDDPNQAVVQAVDFHKGSDPNRPMALTAGLDKTLRFFQVTAEKSEKIHGIHCMYLVKCISSFVVRTVSNASLFLFGRSHSSPVAHVQRRFFGHDRYGHREWSPVVLLSLRFGGGQSR
jgi:hypothetical protein